VALEGIEVAEARRSQDRRPERQVGGVEDRLVLGCGGGVALEQLGQRLDPQAARQVVVQGRDRLAEEDRVVGAAWVLDHQALPRLFEVQPGHRLRARIARGSQPPGRAGRGVPLADVSDLHRPESTVE